MHLLASYFPYEISDGQDGRWSFWNRHQYPVGVNLSEDDDRWCKLWDSYPPRRVELRGIDAAAARGLSCPEWLAADGNPVEAESIRLYGTTSHPTASEDDMAAYLERLRILMEAGAMRTHFPYGMELQRGGDWVFFNRNYKPVGMNLGVGPGTWIRYRDWPVAAKLTDVERGTLARLSYTGAYDEARGVPGQAVHFYDETAEPLMSVRNMDAYLTKLRRLMLLDGASNTKAPWQYRLARYVRKTATEAGPLGIASALAKLLRP